MQHLAVPDTTAASSVLASPGAASASLTLLPMFRTIDEESEPSVTPRQIPRDITVGIPPTLLHKASDLRPHAHDGLPGLPGKPATSSTMLDGLKAIRARFNISADAPVDDIQALEHDAASELAIDLYELVVNSIRSMDTSVRTEPYVTGDAPSLDSLSSSTISPPTPMDLPVASMAAKTPSRTPSADAIQQQPRRSDSALQPATSANGGTGDFLPTQDPKSPMSENSTHLNGGGNVAGSAALDTASPWGSTAGLTPFAPRPKLSRDMSAMSLNSAASYQSLRQKHPYRHHGTAVHTEDDDGYPIINQYKIMGKIGHGKHGYVMLAEDTAPTHPLACDEDAYVAIKVVPKDFLRGGGSLRGSALLAGDTELDSTIHREVAIMKKLHHKNLVAVYEAIEDDYEGVLYIVMQYVNGGPLINVDEHNQCAPVDELDCRQRSRQLAAAIEYLHNHHIAHLDIKPDNILVDMVTDVVYLVDFGVSEILEDCPFGSSTTSQAGGSGKGTPAFFSPEIVRGEAAGPPADMWALGITIYMLLCGKLPVPGQTTKDILDGILKLNHETIRFREGLSREAVDVLLGLLHPNPAKRMTAKEFRRHPFNRTAVKSPCMDPRLSSASDFEGSFFEMSSFMSPTDEEMTAAIVPRKHSLGAAPVGPHPPPGTPTGVRRASSGPCHSTRAH